ncbi:MAG: molybdenum cofactor biosynthesis protein MoaE [Sphingomonas bacterium]|nr:molybdenum cofactor biosynthesis protein MoaE [Sphingomonas bacterium]
MIRIDQAPFDPAAELSALAARAPGSGAIASFVGLVRPSAHDTPVEQLELEQYERFTRTTIDAIAADARTRFALLDLTIIHRCGQLSPGEPIVLVAAAALHRRGAFDAVDYLMDRLKTEAPFWKREHGPAGSRWIEPLPSDHAARKRWEQG